MADKSEIQNQGVALNDEGVISGLDYPKFVPQLLKLVQMQEKRISELETQI